MTICDKHNFYDRETDLPCKKCLKELGEYDEDVIWEDEEPIWENKINLNDLQQKFYIWLEHNFPNTTKDAQLIGVMEELGELSHAHLKLKQGIRGATVEKNLSEIKDSIGDIVIYLINYCNVSGLNFEECVQKASDEVLKRDWIKYPENGVNK